MDPRFPVFREELYSLQMELKQVQCSQSNHTERILRLEKRHADDAALKSVWNSPFPGVIGGTPQQGSGSTSLLDDPALIIFKQARSRFPTAKCLTIWMSRASSS